MTPDAEDEKYTFFSSPSDNNNSREKTALSIPAGHRRREKSAFRCAPQADQQPQPDRCLGETKL